MNVKETTLKTLVKLIGPQLKAGGITVVGLIVQRIN